MYRLRNGGCFRNCLYTANHTLYIVGGSGVRECQFYWSCVVGKFYLLYRNSSTFELCRHPYYYVTSAWTGQHEIGDSYGTAYKDLSFPLLELANLPTEANINKRPDVNIYVANAASVNMKLNLDHFFCWGLLKDRVASVTFHGRAAKTTINRIRTSNRFDENPNPSFPRIIRDFGSNVNTQWGMNDYDCNNIADIKITFNNFIFKETNPGGTKHRDYFTFTSGATKNAAVTFNNCEI